MIHEMLLAIPTFPDAVPERTLESAFKLAHILRARLTVHLHQLNSDRSTWPVVMGSYPIDFPQLMDQLVLKSEANAADSVECLTNLQAERGVAMDLRRGVDTPYASPAALVDLARLHDMVILPVPEIDSFGRHYLQAVLFGSGRPVILLPSDGKPLQWLDRIVVAWDWSREAARALADAMPLLPLAKEVHIVTVFGERHMGTSSVRADLERYLSAHQVKHSFQHLDLGGDRIGDVLMNYTDSVRADLLVMGAFGHPRLQEFILGGATRDILHNPKLPVLLSH